MTGPRKGAGAESDSRASRRGADRNRSALPVRLGILVDLYGMERIASALAVVCEREAVHSRGLRREGALRRFGAALRELAADAREELDEGLAAASGRIIGRRTRFTPEAGHTFGGVAAGAYAVVTAVRKSGIRKSRGAPRLTTNRAVHAAGGLTRYDLVEIEVYADDGTWLGTDDVPATALCRFAHLR
jgi:hypothetical protein